MPKVKADKSGFTRRRGENNGLASYACQNFKNLYVSGTEKKRFSFLQARDNSFDSMLEYRAELTTETGHSPDKNRAQRKTLRDRM